MVTIPGKRQKVLSRGDRVVPGGNKIRSAQISRMQISDFTEETGRARQDFEPMAPLIGEAPAIADRLAWIGGLASTSATISPISEWADILSMTSAKLENFVEVTNEFVF